MRLREENETLMETLVRAKVELAETQGVLLASLQDTVTGALALRNTRDQGATGSRSLNGVGTLECSRPRHGV